LALINQKRRVQIRVNENSYVIASPEDFQKALNILQYTLRETVARLGKRQQEVLGLFTEGDTLDKHQVAERLKVSTDTASKALKSLAKAGYLKENTATKPYTYEPLQNKPEALGILENPSQYRLFWQENLEKWLKDIAATLQSRGIIFQIWRPEENEANAVSAISEAENKEKIRNLDFQNEKTHSPNIRVAEVPSQPNLSPIPEKSRIQLGFQHTPNGKALFLWRSVKPAEKCEFCGKSAVEYEVIEPVNRQAIRRCQNCFNQLRQTFSNSVWKNIEEEGLANV
ncbi:MAG: hypothetical protein QW717_07965, partial [Candidatus Bathyarchaeia archaeon]